MVLHKKAKRARVVGKTLRCDVKRKKGIRPSLR